MNEVDRMKKARNAYAKAWRAKNPDKVKAAADRYWAKKAAELEAEENKAKGDQNDGNQDA